MTSLTNNNRQLPLGIRIAGIALFLFGCVWFLITAIGIFSLIANGEKINATIISCRPTRFGTNISYSLKLSNNEKRQDIHVIVSDPFVKGDEVVILYDQKKNSSIIESIAVLNLCLSIAISITSALLGLFAIRREIIDLHNRKKLSASKFDTPSEAAPEA